MIRPCRACGGSGRVQCDGSNHADGVPCGDEDVRSTGTNPWMVCPDCKDMPWILAPATLAEAQPGVQMTGKFKPQRGTVMRWCKTHESRELDKTGRCAVVAFQIMVAASFGDEEIAKQFDSELDDCDIVWVEKPTPLGEAT